MGVYDGDRQIGFARAVSGGASVTYLADVYVLPESGSGLGGLDETDLSRRAALLAPRPRPQSGQ